MRKVKTLLAIGFTLLANCGLNAQDSITVSDAIEMRVKSESLIKRELKELMDNISTNESSQNTKDVINGSHSGTNNKIFYNEKVIIEDDINPSFKSSAATREVTVDKYLSDLDLFYKKSESPSIFFNDIRTSNVKKVTDLYVKVYFKSLFKNPNKYSDTAYTENNRAAEIRFLKVNKKWVPYIASITFFNPADTVNDVSNDILVIREKGQKDIALSDSAALAAQKTFDDELRQKKEKEDIEAYQKQEQAFRNAMKEGDKALEQNDYISALKAFKEAQDIKPYDMVPLTKLNLTRRRQAEATVKKSDLYEQYVREAKGLDRKRRYKEALESYQMALEQKPEEATKLEPEINALTKKYRVLSTLEEKYNAGLYKEAIKAYRDAIKQNKDAKKPEKENSDYYLGIARCNEKMDDPKEALKNFNKSYEADNDNLETIEERAILYKKQNDFVNALTDYKSYVLLAKDNVKIYEELADLKMLINSNTEEAIKFLDDGIRSNPKSARLYLKKGLLLYRKNDLKEADKNFTSSIMIDSAVGFTFFNRGKCQYGLKKYKNAAADFESARNAGLEATYLAEIAALAETMNQKSTEKFAQKAVDSAIYYISTAIDINPANASYRYNRGEYLYSLNKLEDAIINYSDAIHLTPNYTDSYFRRGLSYFYLKKYIPAIADLRAADSLNHSLYQVTKYLGDAYYAIADFAAATAYYEVSLRTIDAGKTPVLPEEIADIYNLLGESYFNTGNYEKALASFKSALKKNSNHALAYYNRGLTYYKTSSLNDAIDDLSKAVILKRTQFEWYYTLASAYQEKKEYLKAAENYGLGIKLDTAHKRIDALYNKGLCNFQVQNWNEALKDYEGYRVKAATIPDKSFDLQLGIIYLNTARKDSAYNCFYRIYQQDTTNGVAMYNIGRTLYFNGKTDESLLWFDKSFQTKAITKSDIKKEKMNDLFWEDKKFKSLRSKYF